MSATNGMDASSALILPASPTAFASMRRCLLALLATISCTVDFHSAQVGPIGVVLLPISLRLPAMYAALL